MSVLGWVLLQDDDIAALSLQLQALEETGDRAADLVSQLTPYRNEMTVRE